MNKSLIIIFSVLLSLLLVIMGISFFFFSQRGNDMLKPYLKQELEQQIGLPVKISTFKLESGTSRLDMVINKQLIVRVVVNYSLWDQSFEGIYHVKADKLFYNDVQLRQADIKGNFKGFAEDIYVDGKGTVLDAEADYRLRVIDNLPQKLEVNIKGMQLAEVLQVVGQPALAQGKIDVEINMPNIGEDPTNGYGHIVLNKAYFNHKLVKKLYDYPLPKKSYVSGTVDATLEGKNIELVADAQSNLFEVQIKNASLNILSKQLMADYRLDVKNMRILTQNKLAGTFKLEGEVQVQEDEVQATGKSNSLGGELRFTAGKTSKITFEKLALEKLLYLLKQPNYAKGELNGTVVLDDSSMNSGTYVLSIDKGTLESRSIAKMFGYKISAKNSFSLQSEGKIANKKLMANATLHSTLSDATLSEIKYDLAQKVLVSNYDVLLHDVRAFMPASKVSKDTVISAKGMLKFTDRLSISGVMKGLGKKLAFNYDGNTAKIDAYQLFIGKILALSALPVYVKGMVDSKVVLSNLEPLDGTFSFKSTNLVTQPKEMKKLTGKALKLKIALDTSGTLKKGKGYIKTKMKTSMGNLSLKNMVYDIQNNVFKSDYTLNIPNLKKIYPLIDKKLNGALVLNGQLSKGKALKVTGVTKSLGGQINYTLLGDRLSSKISTVPLINILGTLGYKKIFLGQASGTANYNLQKQLGIVDLSIASFQIKPSTLTNTIKMFLGKDPSRIIFSSTQFHSNIKKNIVTYMLRAKGARRSLDISSGRINTINNTHTAKFKFVYEKHIVYGKIKGTLDNPKVTLDTTSLLKDKVKDKLKNKLEKELGGKAGELLKGLSF